MRKIKTAVDGLLQQPNAFNHQTNLNSGVEELVVALEDMAADIANLKAKLNAAAGLGP